MEQQTVDIRTGPPVFGGEQFPDPVEHAKVLIDVKHGDHLGAWTLALLVLRYTPKSYRSEREYWFEVAEAIAKCRPTHIESHFLRGSQLATP